MKQDNSKDAKEVNQEYARLIASGLAFNEAIEAISNMPKFSHLTLADVSYLLRNT